MAARSCLFALVVIVKDTDLSKSQLPQQKTKAGSTPKFPGCREKHHHRRCQDFLGQKVLFAPCLLLKALFDTGSFCFSNIWDYPEPHPLPLPGEGLDIPEAQLLPLHLLFFRKQQTCDSIGSGPLRASSASVIRRPIEDH